MYIHLCSSISKGWKSRKVAAGHGNASYKKKCMKKRYSHKLVGDINCVKQSECKRCNIWGGKFNNLHQSKHAYWIGTSPGPAKPCHKIFLRFRLEGGPIKMCKSLITVSPNTSFSSCVANKSLSRDGHWGAQEYDKYTSPSACSKEDVNNSRHKL